MDKKKILIVDDEQDVLSVLEEGLGEQGYSVIATDNGEDGLALAKSERPNVILLDVLMPGMYGGLVAAILKETPETKNIPIIFLSCLYSKKEDVEKDYMLRDGVYVSKPYEIEELIAKIKKLIREEETLHERAFV